MEKNIQTNTLSWKGPSILHHTRGTAWYAGAIVTIGLLLLFCVLANAWSFLVILLLSIGFYGWLLFKPTPLKTISMSPDGVTYDGEFYPNGAIKEFWILDHGHDFELHIRLFSRLKDDLRIFLAEADAPTVRSFLSQNIPENTEHNEKLLDILARLLKI